MIVERLANPSPPAAQPPRLQEALEFLRGTDLAALPAGRHDIDGDRIFALVQEYTTKPPDQCAWESHRMYMDVQYVISGVERMGYLNLTQAREREPYDSARDVAFYEPGADYVTIAAGMLAIFGPEDVHAPCGAAGSPSAVKKVVVKVAL
jgi:YhcH/YjgK/YiaL family protein